MRGMARPGAMDLRTAATGAPVKLAFAAALVGAIVWAVDGGAALSLLRAADPAWLLAALAALTVQTFASAVRWRITAGQLGQRFGTATALREYYLGQLVNQALPGGVMGDAGRAVRMRAEAGLGNAAAAVMIERFAGQLALAAVMAAGLVAALAVPGGFVPGVPVLAGVGAVVAAFAALIGSVAIGLRLPGAAGRGAARVAGVLGTALAAAAVLRWQIGLSLVAAACNLLAFAFCARATGTALPAGAVAVLVPLILFAMLVPVTVAGWGLREGAAAALFPLAGASAAAGVAASLAFGLVFLVSALPGLWPLLAGARTAGGAVRTPAAGRCEIVAAPRPAVVDPDLNDKVTR